MTTTETRIQMDPDRPVTDYVGLPYTFITYDGEALEGVTEADPRYHGLRVRFPDGRWAHASGAQWIKGD